MDYLAIIVITFISGVVGTGLGGLIGVLLKRDSNKIVSLLLSFAGGEMLPGEKACRRLLRPNDRTVGNGKGGNRP